MHGWLTGINIIGALVLVLLNGFFVAAEFALVKVRGSQLDALVREGRPFAETAQWLGRRLDASLSACQLGITMASLGLGYIAEPAFAAVFEVALESIGLHSPALIHGISFAFAFSLITALHLVIGEQAPKIFAIRRPEVMVLWCAIPLWFFYVILYPFLVALNWATLLILGLMGLKGPTEHEAPHTEAEIRTLLAESRMHGELTGTEHRLLDAVFEFDDMVCRRVMVPRSDVDLFDINQSLDECIETVRRTKHTRYPVCDGSLDDVLGVVHIKDLLGLDTDSGNLRSVMRPPRLVPETLPISQLLRHFQATHQLMALVVDEHGTVIGIVTLENVLEEIVGPVEDEFDTEPIEIVPHGQGEFIVLGTASVDDVNRRLGLALETSDVDTFSGLLTSQAGRILEAGQRVELDGAVAEVLDVRRSRAERIRVLLEDVDQNESDAEDS